MVAQLDPAYRSQMNSSNILVFFFQSVQLVDFGFASRLRQTNIYTRTAKQIQNQKQKYKSLANFFILIGRHKHIHLER